MDAPNPTAASLLGFLHHGPMTGYDLSLTAETVIGSFWSLTRSQVYRELTRMEEAGLVAAGAPGIRDRRPFAITEDGREAFARWSRSTPDEETIRFPLLLAVALGSFADREVLDRHLERHRQVHEDRLRDYETMADAGDAIEDGDPFSRATLEFGLRYERMVLDWFATLPDLLP